MLDAVPDIEEQERMRYQMMETPKMDNAPENIEEELRKAPATDDLMMLFAPHHWTIYYAYLREEMEKHPELSLETDDEIQALDTEVMQDLYQDGYAYPHIMDIMMNSVLYHNDKLFRDPDMCWLYTTMRVTAAINPVLDLPDVKNAPLLRDSSWKEFKPEDYYHAGLRAILDRKPSLRLREADPLVAKMILDSGYTVRFVKECLEQASPQFRLDEDTLFAEGSLEVREKLYSDRTKRVEECIRKAQSIESLPPRRIPHPIHIVQEHPLPDEKDLPPMPAPETFLRPSDQPLTEADFLPPEPLPAVSRNDYYDEYVAGRPLQEIPSYESMREKLLALRDKQKSDDTVRYWTESIKLIRDALLQIDQQKETCKALYAWAGGIRKGERELDIPEDTEIARIFAESRKFKEQLRRNAELQLRELEEQSRILNQFDQLSRQFLSHVAETIEKNPLLRLREVQEAGDLDILLPKDDTPDKAIYAAALRKAALSKSCQTLLDGDREACNFLTDAGLDKERVNAILSCSPRLRDLPDEDRLAALDELRSERKPIHGKPEKPTASRR